jgi:hypothetical protein
VGPLNTVSPGYTPISTHTPASTVHSSPRPKRSSISLTCSPSVVDFLRDPACGLDWLSDLAFVCFWPGCAALYLQCLLIMICRWNHGASGSQRVSRFHPHRPQVPKPEEYTHWKLFIPLSNKRKDIRPGNNNGTCGENDPREYEQS